MSTTKTTPPTHEEFGHALREYLRELREEIREQARAVAEQEFPNDSDARASLTQYLLDYSFLWAKESADASRSGIQIVVLSFQG